MGQRRVGRGHVFAQRKTGLDQLPSTTPRLLPLDEAAEAKRAANVGQQFGKVAPGIVEYTTDVLFHDLWLRPNLAPRDRSLVTIAALAAMGDDDQLDFYLRRGLASGLTRAQITEALTHLGFYAGWTRATKAIVAVTRTLGK